jgi:hypothetical protein
MPSRLSVCNQWQTAEPKGVWKPTPSASPTDSTYSAHLHRDFTWRHYSGEDSLRSPKGSVTVAQFSKASFELTAEGVLR